MKLSLFDYHLDPSKIAQHPSEIRDHSKLLRVDKLAKQDPIDHMFYDLPNLLSNGDVLVINNTKVIPARLFGTKLSTGAHIELLLLDEIEKNVYNALTKPAKKIDVDDEIILSDTFKMQCVDVKEDGIRVYQLIYDGILIEHLESLGKLPLPPYVKELNDDERYQTIYAKHSGSSAAPTAGLHFTEDIFDALKQKGIEIIEITLHVGLGTFKPVQMDDITKHHMHEETYVISNDAAQKLNDAKRAGKRIIAVGTTSLRTLESNINNNAFHEGNFQTSIFIYPGYTFKAIDGLITNFHLPKSTLLMLVSAITERKYMLSCYQHAIDYDYRFFSFGDAMLIL
ncbi:MAG: tRNA preQ1(34) S-adenosylmethionine ribosyltransferase-isomerase QueA [Firmicutes bacterium]|nr:tRNA preQ1(34) S-adenosylmethionine ribosyltransferase-isomerase QueA [Bacillota bacterium]